MVGRESRGWLAIVLLSAIAHAESPEQAPPLNVGPYEVQLYFGVEEPDSEDLRWSVRFLDELRSRIDKELRGADLLAAKKGAAKPEDRWSVCICANRHEAKRAIGGAQEPTTKGSGFYVNAQRGAVLVFVPSDDRNADRRNLLDYGLRQILYHRLGFRYSVNQDAPGACLPFALFAWFRWSFLPAGVEFPRHLGGMRAKDLQRVQARIRERQLPDLRALFALRYSEIVPGGKVRREYAIPAMLWIEFLWERPKSRRALLHALAAYAEGGHSPQRFPYAVLKKALPKELRNGKAMERKFRAYVLEESDPLNREKWRDNTASPEPD
ncbi:MAG: hypothetical protein AAGD14_07630 [Planctomycetota bacterium]